MPRLGGGRRSKGDDQRRVGGRGQDELVRPDRERPLGKRGLGRGGQLRLRRLRIELGIATRTADPEARDRGVAPGLGRIGLEDPGGPGRGEVGGDLGVREEVGARRRSPPTPGRRAGRMAAPGRSR